MADILADMAKGSASMLLLGPPGVGQSHKGSPNSVSYRALLYFPASLHNLDLSCNDQSY